MRYWWSPVGKQEHRVRFSLGGKVFGDIAGGRTSVSRNAGNERMVANNSDCP